MSLSVFIATVLQASVCRAFQMKQKAARVISRDKGSSSSLNVAAIFARMEMKVSREARLLSRAALT